MYCRSMIDFVGPKTWVDSVAMTLSGPAWQDGVTGAVSIWFWYFLAGAIVLIGALIFVSAKIRQGLILLGPMAAFGAAGGEFAANGFAKRIAGGRRLDRPFWRAA